MLAQNFKSAVDLGLTEAQVSALQKTLVLLETGQLVHFQGKPNEPFDFEPLFSGKFNMNLWTAKHDCGTVACIGGTAEMVGNVSFGRWAESSNKFLIELFAPKPAILCKWSDITPAQAAIALRSYLTTGHAHWALALA